MTVACASLLSSIGWISNRFPIHPKQNEGRRGEHVKPKPWKLEDPNEHATTFHLSAYR